MVSSLPVVNGQGHLPGEVEGEEVDLHAVLQPPGLPHRLDTGHLLRAGGQLVPEHLHHLGPMPGVG